MAESILWEDFLGLSKLLFKRPVQCMPLPPFPAYMEEMEGGEGAVGNNRAHRREVQGTDAPFPSAIPNNAPGLVDPI
jgi:hypothetical protein